MKAGCVNVVGYHEFVWFEANNLKHWDLPKSDNVWLAGRILRWENGAVDFPLLKQNEEISSLNKILSVLPIFRSIYLALKAFVEFAFIKAGYGSPFIFPSLWLAICRPARIPLS